MKAARRREVDAILVWRLDRWGRSLLDLVVSLKELSELGVGFVSMAGLLAVFAEFEREILRERVKAGIVQARRRAARHGRPSTTAPQADQILALHAEGKRKSQIARQLGLARTSVRRALAGKPAQVNEAP